MRAMKHLPMALTLARLIAGPIIAGLILWGDAQALTEGMAAASAPFIAALVLFVLAALTDALDGILARRLGVTSTLGAALDHAADKVLTICTLVALAVTALASDLVVAAILILARDAAIGGLREGLALSGKALPVSQGGKLKTVLVLVGVGAALTAQTVIYANGPAAVIDWAGLGAKGALWAGAAVALWTGAAYVQAVLGPSASGRLPQD
jgi:CDP-diacylglycerol--glycerol-3-phosphate 3-phosphatidyltransferase